MKSIMKILVATICIAFIVWGCFSSYKIYQLFNVHSATHGEAILQALPGDDKDFDINEDESIFLAYTVENLELEEVATDTYRATKSIEALKYNPKVNDYNLYVNAHKYAIVKLDNMLDANIRMQLLTPDATRVSIDLGVRFLFYAGHTELILTIPKESVGYMNQMTNGGMNIRLIESPIDEDFVMDGTVTAITKERQHHYSFAVTPGMLDIDYEEGIYSPYYVYGDSNNTSVCISSNNANSEFFGIIYHTGFEATQHLSEYEIPWESDTPTINLPGLIEGSNYKVSFRFANGITKDATYHYQSKDEYFGYGDGSSPDRYIKLLSAIPESNQTYEESGHYYYSYSGEAVGPGTNPHAFHNIDINPYNLHGAFHYALETESYGTIDLLLNPSFYTKNGVDWSFTCAVYLVNPISGNSSAVAEIANAMHNQIAFEVIINY